MKIYIVFLALLIMNVSFLVYQKDMNQYIRLQEGLKTVAAECAHGGAMLFDEQEFGKGLYVFNDQASLAHINYMTNKLEQLNPSSPLSEIRDTVYFFDDSLHARVYEDGRLVQNFPFTYPHSFMDKTGYIVKVNSPCIAISLEGKLTRAFRLPYLRSDQIIRSAMYENIG